MSSDKYYNEDSLTCCEETIEPIPFPLCDLQKSSTVAFNIDDGIVETELTVLRLSNGRNSSNLTNKLSDTYKNFKKTIKILCLLVIMFFLMAALWIVYLWWDTTNNHHGHGESDQISTWKRNIFSL